MKVNNIIREVLENMDPSEKLLIRDKLIIATKINRALRELGYEDGSDYLFKNLKLDLPDCHNILSGDYDYTLELLAKLEQLLNINFFKL